VSRRVFTPEQEQRVVDAYRSGQTLQQIAATMGGTTTSVANTLRRHGVERRRGADAHGSRIAQGDPELQAEALRLYTEGYSVKRLSERYGCNTTVISDLLRESGTTLHPGGKAHPRFRTEAECMALVAEYEAGASIKGLARRYGCGAPVIARAIVRGGGTPRNPGISKVWTDETLGWAAEQYRAGRSQQSIAAELGCDQSAVSARLRRIGVIPPAPRARGADHGSWRGGRTIDGNGYVSVLVMPDDLPYCKPNSSGRVLEHRLVMGRALGRPLRRHETVHHIDGNTQNNEIENLQLRQGRHGKGVVMTCRSCGSHDIEAVQIAS
jgi:transposase-like protein